MLVYMLDQAPVADLAALALGCSTVVGPRKLDFTSKGEITQPTMKLFGLLALDRSRLRNLGRRD